MSRCRETRPGMPCGSQIGVPHSTDWGTAVFQSTRDFPGPSIPLAIPAAHFFPALPTDSTSSAASVSAPGFARCSAGGPGDGPVPYRPPLLDTPKVGRGGQERTDEAWDTGRRRSRSREPSYGMDSGTAASARGFSVRGRHPGTAGAGDVRSRGQGSKHLRTSAATPAEPGIPHRHVASGRPYDSQQNQDYNSTAHQSGVKNGVLYRPSEAELQGFGFTHTRGLAAGDPGGGSDLLSKDVRGRTEQSPDCEGVSASMPVSQRPLLHRRTSLYADQIIDYHTGKLCPKRVKAAFMSVAQSVNLPHLVMPRWGHTAFAPSTTGMEVPAQFVCVTGGSGGGASLVNAGVWHHGSFVKPPVETATAWNHPGVPLGTELRPGDGESAMLDMSEVSSDESDEEMEDGEVEEARKRARPSRQRSGPGTQAPSSSWTTEPLSFQDGGAPDPDKGRVSLSVRPETAAASTSSSEKAPLWDPIVAKDLAAEAEHEKHSDVLQQQRSQTEGKVHPGPSSLLGPAPQRNAAALWPSASGVFGTQFGSSTGGSTSSVPVPASASPSAGEPGTETRSEGRTGRGESAVASNQAADTQLSSPSGAGEETERSLSRPRPTDPRLARQLKQRQQQSDSGQAASAEASSSAAPSGAAPLAAALSESSTNAAVPGVMRYVSTFDGSTIEMKNPPEPPAPGTLPAGLEQTCVARGKLPLLLDLDNTLLHAQAAAVTGCDVRLQDWLDSYGEPELYRFELPCNRKTYYMKLRPYLRTFLKQLEPFYEMSVYTNATQEYADIVVAILDEDRQLFRDRIVARDSAFRGEASENKAVRRLYEGMDKRCIVAFDDRQNIWTDLPLTHVVKAQHYDFFDSHKAELNAYYPPLTASGVGGVGGIDTLGNRPGEDEVMLDPAGCSPFSPAVMQQPMNTPVQQQLARAAANGKKPFDWDRHLECMLKLFLHLHAEFFKDPANANIGAILCNVQQKVLSGVGIFFTGYRKTFSPGAAVADCEERQAELAQRLGAKVYKRYDEEGVTHVVAGKNNTNNMLACKGTKLARVHTLWLYCCEAALARVPESAFDADTLCTYYDNSPPAAPYRDHWVHLAQEKSLPENPPAHPFPPPESVPVREFLGTGPYSDGATLTSPYEEVLFIWRPEKQTVRQLYATDDSRSAALTSSAKVLSIAAGAAGSLCVGICGSPMPLSHSAVSPPSQPQRLQA